MTPSLLPVFWLFITVVLTTFVVLRLLAPHAARLHLIDLPNRRKLHEGQVPLIGGISIYLGAMCGFSLWLLMRQSIAMDEVFFWLVATLTVLVGVYDDRRDLSVRLRIVFQALLILLLVVGSGNQLNDLGFLFGEGFGVVDLGIFSLIFTLIAMLGIVNAFNMVDGIDGLLGGLALVSLTSLAWLAWTDGAMIIASTALLVVAGLVPFLLCNLVPQRLGCKKVFMGDAGALFIGLTVAWLLVLASQTDALAEAVANGTAVAMSESVIRPVTALWLVAIPLMDTVAVIIRRIAAGRNPFKADREHLHHLLIRYGCSQLQAMLLIVTAAFLCAGIGVLSDMLRLSEVWMFVSFLSLFALYYAALSLAWRRV
ncbi:MAG: undecaprenyl-phosphate alpha-N-acetylglucosaminyl 1-phosphate transferase [Aliidiomarina sp.]|uniref:undecaprenyl-phosphate alpha-N-acetylglucosaminyl 1-phosphate transferase n=1 Tax=Aliidiomarina sp. TaxID=1872439 RepID=UPI0025BA501E|nr:undecaprenyl-phosphate alpha-N-acetylglucosaminyl 1-phosphate transferase [Aliidiomarina sp.]MCH8502479.1 undecaprenyl-phosphate alpha-N-acetylglucosaminyl 1-phosphate transferase [Aliidiomarina sp.]